MENLIHIIIIILIIIVGLLGNAGVPPPDRAGVLAGVQVRSLQ